MTFKLAMAHWLIRIFGFDRFNRWHQLFRSIRDRRAAVDLSGPPVDQSPPVAAADSKPGAPAAGGRHEILPYLKNAVKNPAPGENFPLVSLIVPVERDDPVVLKRLFDSIQAYTIYPQVEMILIVDPACKSSCRLIAAFNFSADKIVCQTAGNIHSQARGTGVQKANGDYLAFLKMDTEVCYGWLIEAMRCFAENSQAACVGATVLSAEGMMVKNRGFSFRYERDCLRLYPLDQYRNPLDPPLRHCVRPVVAASCQIWRKDKLTAIGGFENDHASLYANLDRCLRYWQAGHQLIVCATSFVIDHGVENEADSVRLTNPQASGERAGEGDADFAGRWLHPLKQHYWQEKIAGRSILAAHPLTIAIILTEDHPATTCGDYAAAKGLGGALQRLGYRIVYLSRFPLAEWQRIPNDVDLLLVLMDEVPLHTIEMPPGVIKVAWIRNWVDRWCSRPWLQAFDMVLANSNKSLEVLSACLTAQQYSAIMRLAVDYELFGQQTFDPAYASDICFVGNIFHVPRDIVQNLPLDAGYRFRFWGRLARSGHPFAPFHEGPVPYSRVPAIYKSAKIVMEDCTQMCRPWGCINSRTFEAMACGACLVSNEVPELSALFPDELLVYHTKAELKALLHHYLKDDKARKAIGQRAKQAVLAGHTYDHRARELQHHLAAFLGIDGIDTI